MQKLRAPLNQFPAFPGVKVHANARWGREERREETTSDAMMTCPDATRPCTARKHWFFARLLGKLLVVQVVCCCYCWDEKIGEIRRGHCDAKQNRLSFPKDGLCHPSYTEMWLAYFETVWQMCCFGLKVEARLRFNLMTNRIPFRPPIKGRHYFPNYCQIIIKPKFAKTRMS